MLYMLCAVCAGLAWMPTLGNVITLAAFLLCVYLNNSITGAVPALCVLPSCSMSASCSVCTSVCTSCSVSHFLPALCVPEQQYNNRGKWAQVYHKWHHSSFCAPHENASPGAMDG